MTYISASVARRTETPNAVMTTLASPTQGGAGHSLWRVDMRPGQAGPAHAFDMEQVWTALAGAATVELGDGAPLRLAPGDTAVLAAGITRRVAADPEAGFSAIVAGAPAGRALLPDGTDRGTPDWMA